MNCKDAEKIVTSELKGWQIRIRGETESEYIFQFKDPTGNPSSCLCLIWAVNKQTGKVRGFPRMSNDVLAYLDTAREVKE